MSVLKSRLTHIPYGDMYGVCAFPDLRCDAGDISDIRLRSWYVGTPEPKRCRMCAKHIFDGKQLCTAHWKIAVKSRLNQREV